MDDYVYWKASWMRPTSYLCMHKNTCKETMTPKVCRDWQTWALLFLFWVWIKWEKQTNIAVKYYVYRWLIDKNWMYFAWIVTAQMQFSFWKQEWPQTWLFRDFEQVPIQVVPSFLPDSRPVFYCVDRTECTMPQTGRMLNEQQIKVSPYSVSQNVLLTVCWDMKLI